MKLVSRAGGVKSVGYYFEMVPARFERGSSKYKAWFGYLVKRHNKLDAPEASTDSNSFRFCRAAVCLSPSFPLLGQSLIVVNLLICISVVAVGDIYCFCWQDDL